MEDENLYDEFGNYIGPDLDQDQEEDQNLMNDMDSMDDEDKSEEEMLGEKPLAQENKIVLHEDKKYYPDMNEVYPGVETLVMEEDDQTIEQALIESHKTKTFEKVVNNLPETTFSYEFLTSMMNKPELIRNVAIVGHLHSGKTMLMDMFVQQCHPDMDPTRELKYTDNRIDEQERKISLKALPMSLILPDSRDKSFLVNLFDTPGHPNFSDEMCCALRACDGALLVVDAVEGVMIGTERMIKYLVHENIAITVIINKMDRLILELKLPPADAYLKIKHTLEEINGLISAASYHLTEEEREKLKISPVLGNVVFASSEYGFSFSLSSFVNKYAQYSPGFKPEFFMRVLWGDFYYNHETRQFSTQAKKDSNTRAFVEFILEPLYKLMAHSVAHEYKELSVGVYLRREQYKLDAKILLKLACQGFFGNTSCIVDMMVKHIPHAFTGTATKVDKNYSGNRETDLYQRIKKCDPKEPLVINIVKMYHKADCVTFDAFGRVISGTIHKGQTVKILGENYSLEDEEDMAVKTAKTLWIYQGRYRVEANKVPAGNWVLIEGIDQSITKTATITSAKETEQIEIFKPIKFNTLSVVKIAIEPLIPSELPKMLEGIRKVNKSYPLLVTRVEESGEHNLIGTGELYMDCVMHDLRNMYSEIEIKISDPCVSFCETVIDTSSIKCYAQTPNKKNKLTMLANPLDKGLADDIENEHISIGWEKKKISDFFQSKYDWDILAARSLWAFGPDSVGPNVLLDDSLPSETDKKLLYSVKESIVAGFQWCTKEGPLCEEPIRNVKFKVIEASIAQENIYRGGGQMIPTTRRVANSSFLMATPRLMEPVMLSEIQCSADCLNALYLVLQRRRGHVISELAKPGSPLYTVKANIPAIDYFGFETDLRVHTSGQAFCCNVFDHWSLLPGDPLDKNIVIKPLEPSAPPQLARERRKGLNEDVSIVKFFDDPKILEILKNDDDYKAYL